MDNLSSQNLKLLLVNFTLNCIELANFISPLPLWRSFESNQICVASNLYIRIEFVCIKSWNIYDVIMEKFSESQTKKSEQVYLQLQPSIEVAASTSNVFQANKFVNFHNCDIPINWFIGNYQPRACEYRGRYRFIGFVINTFSHELECDFSLPFMGMNFVSSTFPLSPVIITCRQRTYIMLLWL